MSKINLLEVDPASLLSQEDPVDIFELTEQLAVGAFGAVYSGVYLPTKEIVAVKICALEDDDSLPELLGEISILKKISHPNSIKFFGAYQKDQELFIAMELAAGGAVNTLFEANPSLSEPVITFIIQESLKGLVYLHETCHIIHRDIKAPNVLLTKEGQVKLADFGVSAVLSDPHQRRRTFVGTPWWMAPEIIQAANDFNVTYDYKVDVWAVGIMCIELAEAMPPLCNLQPMDVLDEIVNREPPELKNPHQWSAEFRHFIAECLIRDIESRPSTSTLLMHKWIKQCKGTAADVKVLLQNKEKVVFQQIQETVASTVSSASTSKEEDEEQEEESEDSEEEDVGFQPKTMAAKLATTKTMTIARTNAGVTSVGQTLREQVMAEKEMHIQLREMKKQQKEAQKLLDGLEKQNQQELQKLEKKKAERHAGIDKDEKKAFKKLEKDQQTEREEIESKNASDIKTETKTHATGLKELKKIHENEHNQKVKSNKDKLKAEAKDKKKQGLSKDQIKEWEITQDFELVTELEKDYSSREIKKVVDGGKAVSELKAQQIELYVELRIKQFESLTQKKEEFETQKQKVEIDFLNARHDQEMKHCDALDQHTKNAWNAQQKIRLQQFDKGAEAKEKENQKKIKAQKAVIEKELKAEEKKVIKEKKMDKNTASALYKEKRALKTQQYECTSACDYLLDKKMAHLHLLAREEDLLKLEETNLRNRLKIKSRQLGELQAVEQTDKLYDEMKKYIDLLEGQFDDARLLEQLTVLQKTEFEAVEAALKLQSTKFDEHFQHYTKAFSGIKKSLPPNKKESTLDNLKKEQEAVLKNLKDDQAALIKKLTDSISKKKKEFSKNKDRIQKEKEKSAKAMKDRHNERVYFSNENQFKALVEIIDLRPAFHQRLEEKHTEFRETLSRQVKKELDLMMQHQQNLSHVKGDPGLQEKYSKELQERHNVLRKKYFGILDKDMQRLQTLYESKKQNLKAEHEKALKSSDWTPEKRRGHHHNAEKKERRKSQGGGDDDGLKSASSSDKVGRDRERRKSQSTPDNQHNTVDSRDTHSRRTKS